MSLPDDWVKRIWDKLTITYGRDFMARYAGLDEASVKADWAYELRHFLARPKCLMHALENLPTKPPSVAEFKATAKQWQGPGEMPQLTHDQTAPPSPRVLAALAGLAKPVQRDPKQWARDLLARHEAGDARPAACIAMAREALGLQRPASITTEGADA